MTKKVVLTLTSLMVVGAAVAVYLHGRNNPR